MSEKKYTIEEYLRMVTGDKDLNLVPIDVDDAHYQYDRKINKHLDGFSGRNGDFQSSIVKHEN